MHSFAYMDVGNRYRTYRSRAMQDAYMEVSGRTTQEIKSSSYRGDKVEQLSRSSCLQDVGKGREH